MNRSSWLESCIDDGTYDFDHCEIIYFTVQTRQLLSLWSGADHINARLLANVSKTEIFDLFVKRLHPESGERAKLAVQVASQRLPFSLIEPALWGDEEDQAVGDLSLQDGADVRDLDGDLDGDGAQESITMDGPLYDDEPSNDFDPPEDFGADEVSDGPQLFEADDNPNAVGEDDSAPLEGGEDLDVAGSARSSEFVLVDEADDNDEVYGDPSALGGGLIGLFKSGPTVEQITAAGGLILGMRVKQLVDESDMPADGSQLITDLSSFRAGLKEAPPPIIAEPFTLA